MSNENYGQLNLFFRDLAFIDWIVVKGINLTFFSLAGYFFYGIS
jgi:hypothetical protein